MITTLEIDGINYYNKILRDRPFTLHIKYEDGINNPVSSVMRVSLYNDNTLQNIFLNNSPFSIYQEGYVTVNWDFPSIRLFEGYIDKTSAPVDLSAEIIDLTIIGKEKYIADTMSNYDITQLYWNLAGNTSVRQRGGRAGVPRLDYTQYLSITTLLQTIFGDLGFNSIINYNKLFFGEEKLVYKYDADRYGDITRRKDIVAIRNLTDRGRVRDLDAVYSKSFLDKDSQSNSYNSLLKEFALVTGCIYFYEYRAGKMIFINRDYDFTDDLSMAVFNIDNHLIEENYKTNYKYSYNGISLEFNDVTLGLKRNLGSIIPGDIWEYGIEYESGVKNVMGGKYFLGMSGTPTIIYRVGNGTKWNSSLFVNNALDMQFDGDLKNYLKPASSGYTGGEAIEDFLMEYLKANYEFVLNASQDCEYGVRGIYPAPLRISLGGAEHNVFETEIDIHEQKTILRFQK